MPPTTFGISVKLIGFPGSIRSGDATTKKSLPASKPDSASITEHKILRVIFGPTVLSFIIKSPLFTCLQIYLATERIKVKSGYLSKLGVGTQIIFISDFAAAASGVE